MDIIAAKSQLDILRRIAERGLSASVPMNTDIGYPEMVDVFQHMLDEIAVTVVYLED
jgi:hypothetical protein